MKEKYDVKLEGKEWKDCLKHSFDKKKKDIKMDGLEKDKFHMMFMLKRWE